MRTPKPAAKDGRAKSKGERDREIERERERERKKEREWAQGRYIMSSRSSPRIAWGSAVVWL
jgi:hypothetical protein